MKKIKIIVLIGIMLLGDVPFINGLNSNNADTTLSSKQTWFDRLYYTFFNPKNYDKFAGAMVAGGIGDALGRVTEHTHSTNAIFEKYPLGVRTFDDFREQDWSKLPAELKDNKIAPYTDDTGMARLVMKELIKSRQNDWDLDTTMGAIARSFVIDAKRPMGWLAYFRPYGRACVAGVEELSRRMENHDDQKPEWWNIEAYKAGGCGSVMRAHPFGLVFADNPEKAASWAVEHSKLTHNAPIALAACAAMATGIAYAVQGKSVQFIIDNMINVARRYDVKTADKMTRAYAWAQEAKKLRKPFNDIFEAYRDSGIRVQTIGFRSMNDRFFSTYLGWAADDAIAAVVYAFTLSPDNIMEAIYLGVHTPGDSDSIASMAGALVGSRMGIKQLPRKLVRQLENSADLQADALAAAKLF